MRRSVRRPLLVAGIVTPALAVTAAFVPTAGAQARAAHRSALPLAASPSQPATRSVIVLLRNQFSSTPATPGGLGRRSAAIAADQSHLLASVRGSGGTGVRAYRTANAFAAKVSAAEAGVLARDPSVLEVVPDSVIKGPVRPGDTRTAAPRGSARTPNAPVGPTPGPCPSDPGKPILEPEALQAIHAAYQDNTPSAQQVTTGAGTRVGYIADGVDVNNQDFVRADGSHVFFDYQDFTGDPAGTPTTGAEAFGDASSIAAQGLHSYDLSTFVNEAHPLPAGCTITVRGVAPGTSLAGYNVFGTANATTTSNFLQAIDYAVTVDHLDVLNESFGQNAIPDVATDPVRVFNDAAVAAGVTVVASSGDAGNNNSIGSPATDPLVISAAASTTHRLYAQVTAYGFQFSNGTWVNDNPSSLSSGGVTAGGRTVDLMAPGDLGWALCSTNLTLYTECGNFKDTPTGSGVQEFGGTSQAAPLTAGTAALVISLPQLREQDMGRGGIGSLGLWTTGQRRLEETATPPPTAARGPADGAQPPPHRQGRLAAPAAPVGLRPLPDRRAPGAAGAGPCGQAGAPALAAASDPRRTPEGRSPAGGSERPPPAPPPGHHWVWGQPTRRSRRARNGLARRSPSGGSPPPGPRSRCWSPRPRPAAQPCRRGARPGPG